MSALRIRRLGYALGAEVEGLDLSRPLDDATLAEIKRAWLDHIVLSFPGQELTADQFKTFCSSFGPLKANGPSEGRHPAHPELIVLASVPITIGSKLIEKSIAGVMWHNDFDFLKETTSGTFLLSRELPEVGGNTMFANMYLAYEALSPAMKVLVESLSGIHDVTRSINFVEKSAEEREQRLRETPAMVHPLVRIHPETGRKSLFVGRRVGQIDGMTEEESRPLLDYLNEHATRYEFLHRYVWSVNDLVMWDNRCSLHYAVQDFDQRQLRRMLRCNTAPV